MLNKIKSLITKKDRKILFILLCMGLILSLIEIIGIAAIMPFINIVTDPSIIISNTYFNSSYHFFGFINEKDFILTFGIVLICFYVFRAIYTVFFTYFLNKFTSYKYKSLVDIIFENYLNLQYENFITKNSSEMLKIIITDAGQLSALTTNILNFIMELFILLMIYIMLLFVNLEMTLVLTLILGLKVLLLTKTISKKIKIKGNERVIVEKSYYKIISESLSNFKFIKLLSEQKELIEKFKVISNQFSYIQIYNNTIQILPRILLESFGFSLLIGAMIYLIVTNANTSIVISTISIYALALYRTLPAITKIINSYNNIIFHSKSLDIVYDAVHEVGTLENTKIINFNKSITLKNIYFSYKENTTILNNISIHIQKGKKIAFIGKSGGGKSTLVDLICGLYYPDKGDVFIDNKKLNNQNILSWRKKIGYIPQSIYLFDGTVSENIIFGRVYDKEKLIKVLKQANIYTLILNKDGLDTMVGEGGIQLSGGQKQRIGIARALYGNPEILVLDEATSALDTETETAIMDEIYSISEDKTLIIIAHRLSTIKRCDIKIDLDDINK